ncbi:DNA replication protein psf2 [Savitreella phatthalungensis]
MTQFMALPADHEDSFSPAELDFFAEQEPVRIIPRLQTPRMKLLSTSSRQAKLGSLRVNRRVDVPLWLALLLKRQERCNILIPDWLLVEELEKRVDVERGIIAADGRHRSQSRSQDVVLLQQTEVLQVRNADPSSHAIDSSGRLIHTRMMSGKALADCHYDGSSYPASCLSTSLMIFPSTSMSTRAVWG